MGTPPVNKEYLRLTRGFINNRTTRYERTHVIVMTVLEHGQATTTAEQVRTTTTEWRTEFRNV